MGAGGGNGRRSATRRSSAVASAAGGVPAGFGVSVALPTRTLGHRSRGVATLDGSGAGERDGAGGIGPMEVDETESGPFLTLDGAARPHPMSAPAEGHLESGKGTNEGESDYLGSCSSAGVLMFCSDSSACFEGFTASRFACCS